MLKDPGIRRFLEESNGFYPPDAVDFTIEQQRGFYDRLCAHFRKPRPAGLTTRDISIGAPRGDIPARLYTPAGLAAPAPALVYFHGGGFIVGSLESHDDVCAEIADGARIAVVAVDYRLAPEHRFPAAFDDAEAACVHVIAHAASLGIDPDRVIVGGDSAGGKLSAACCLKLRDDAVRPALKGQILIYPSLGGDRTRGSYIEHADAPGLTTKDMAYYLEMWLGPAGEPGHRSKYAMPLLETDYSDLPAAFMIACEWDPLRDDCFDWRDRLEAAGVPARVRHEPDLIHASLRARNMSEPARAMFQAVTEAAASLAHHGRLP